MAKKKKAAMKKAPECSTHGHGHCTGIFALLIIILVWWQPAVMWSKVVMTVAAAIILLSGHSCCKGK
jgi:hypothetical protein